MSRPTPMEQDTAPGSSGGSGGRERPLDLDNFISQLSDVKLGSLGLALEDIVFQGFQPRNFLVAMLKMAKNKNVNLGDLKKNMVLLGLVCACRGSKLTKIVGQAGTSDRLKTVLNTLKTVYEIKDGRPASSSEATLPRFLAVTALPVSTIIHEDNGTQISLPISPAEVTEDYPLIFCMSHAGGLIPVGQSYTGIMMKAVAYGQFIMSLKFGSKANKFQALQFVKVASTSNLWTDVQKIGHLVTLGLFTELGPIPKVAAALERAAAKFDNIDNRSNQ